MNSVAGKLKINDLRVWAHHGWYEEERQIGAEYRIDLEVGVAVPLDDMKLEDTVDYQAVVHLITEIMKQPFKLIEASCAAIHQGIRKQFNQITDLKVTVTKLDIPINNLSSTSYTISS